LAAGIYPVKGVRKLGSRLRNWLTAGGAAALWQVPDGQTLAGKRNRAILAILLGCGLRRRISRHMISGGPARDSAMIPEASLSRSSFFSGMSPCKPPNAISAAGSV